MLSYRVGSVDAWRAYQTLQKQNGGEGVLLGGQIILYPPAVGDALPAPPRLGGDRGDVASAELCPAAAPAPRAPCRY